MDIIFFRNDLSSCMFYFFGILVGKIAFFVHNKVGGTGGMRMLPAENMNFRLNIRTANLCDSGRLFALSQMPSLQNLKEFLW